MVSIQTFLEREKMIQPKTQRQITEINAEGANDNAGFVQLVAQLSPAGPVPAEIIEHAAQYNRWYASQVGVAPCDHSAFIEWDCCATHRRWNSELATLSAESEKLVAKFPHLQKVKGAGSGRWWAAAGILMQYVTRENSHYQLHRFLYLVGETSPIGMPDDNRFKVL